MEDYHESELEDEHEEDEEDFFSMMMTIPMEMEK